MNRARLTLEDIVRGLSRFGERYHAIHVFADDVEELYALQRREPPGSLTAQGDEGRRFRYQSASRKVYLLEVLPGGVARLSASPDASAGEAPSSARSRAIGAAIGAAAWTKGEGWTGLLLGLLVGPKLGAGEGSCAPRQVFTLRFDAAARRWEAYDGGLLRWMKQELSAPGLL